MPHGQSLAIDEFDHKTYIIKQDVFVIVWFVNVAYDAIVIDNNNLIHFIKSINNT